MFVRVCYEVLLLVLPGSETTVVRQPSPNGVRFLTGVLGCWSAALVGGWCGQAVEQATFLQYGWRCEVFGVKCGLQYLCDGVVEAWPRCVCF